MTNETDPLEDYVYVVLQHTAAAEEAFSSALMDAELCPSGTHGDFVDGEVVPGDLPCRDCGAAL
jgi:hypothetical protein